MTSLCLTALLASTLLGAALNAAVTASTYAACGSPPSSLIVSNDTDAGPAAASAATNIDCIFGGDNTGFAQAFASGSVVGSTHLDLSVSGTGSADTGFLLVPGREDAFHSSRSDTYITLHPLVSGGAPTGVLRITASNCQMLAGIFGYFSVNGVDQQSLTGCGAGTQVFASYTRGVPVQISWVIHAEAFSTMEMQADDSGQFTFDTFELLTTTLDPNPGASLRLALIPEPSSLVLISCGLALVALRRIAVDSDR